MSGNQNVALYAKFENKTTIKTNQNPGGNSNLVLGNPNQKTDYGPQRHYRKLSRQKQSQQQERNNYSEPMRVMEDNPNSYGQKNYGYGVGGGGNHYGNMGGEHGYDGYGRGRDNQPMMGGGGYGYGDPRHQQAYGNQGGYGGGNKQMVDQIDLAIQQSKSTKNQRNPPTMIPSNQRPPSVPRQQNYQVQGKPSIRLNGPPKDNNIFGANNYDYWKEQKAMKGGSGSGSEKRIQYQQPQQQQYQQQYQPQQYQQEQYSQKNIGGGEKTSVRVNNPPGGKQTFSFG